MRWTLDLCRIAAIPTYADEVQGKAAKLYVQDQFNMVDIGDGKDDSAASMVKIQARRRMFAAHGWRNDWVAGKADANIRARPIGLASCEGSVLGNRRGGHSSGASQKAGEEIEGKHVYIGDV